MKRIILIASLDTKGAEAEFVRNLLEKRGHRVTLIDDGVLGRPAIRPEITREEVAAEAGTTIEEVAALGTEGKISRVMPVGLIKIVKRLRDSGELDGLISIGGAIGTSMATTAMRELPVGVPKLMLSTRAGLDESSRYVGTRDVTLMPSICDIQGLNRVTKRLLVNAAGAIAGMVEMAEEDARVPVRPLVVMSEVGTTTRCGLRVKSAVEKAGYEVVIFGGSGIGGRCQEEFVKNSPAQALIELSIYEVSNEIFGGRHASGPNRMEAAGEKGIPQIITPGMVNILSFNEDSIPDLFKNSWEPRQPGSVAVYLNAEQLETVGKAVAEKLNRAKGPVRVLIPNRGFSAFSDKGRKFYDPDHERGFTDSLKASLAPRIALQELDCHINDAEFADAVIADFFELLEAG